MATENINIVIREQGAKVVSRDIKEIGKAAEDSADGVDALSKALGLIATYLGVNEIKDMSSQWIDFNSRIKLAAGSAANAAAVLDRLQQVARRTYSPFAEITEIYLRNATALNDLGYSTKQQLDFTEAMTNALVVSGAKGAQAERVIRELSQSMSKGVVELETWNAILESGGRIAQALATALNTDIDSLRKMQAEGKLTANVVFPALVSQLETLRAEADNMPATINDALVNLKSSLLQVIGELSRTSGFSTAVVAGIDLIRENLETLIGLTITFGTVAAVAYAPTPILGFYNALQKLYVLMLANPFVAVAAAIAGAITYLAYFEDSLESGIDKTTKMSDVFDALWIDFQDSINQFGVTVSDIFAKIEFTIANALKVIDIEFSDSVQEWKASIGEFYSETEGEGFARIVRGIAKTMDAIEGFAKGLYEFINDWFLLMERKLINQIKSLNNQIVSSFPKASEIIGLETQEIDTSSAEGWGVSFGDAMFRGFTNHADRYQKWADGIFDNASEIARKRVAEADLGTANLGGDDNVAKNALALTQKEMNKLEKELRSILSSVASAEGAWLEFARAEEVLNDAVRAGLITRQQQAQYLDLIEDHYSDLADPFGKIIDDMQTEMELLQMSARDREVYAQYLDYESQLKEAGIEVNDAMTESLMKQIVAYQELNEVVQAQDNLLANSVEARREYSNQLKAINDLLANPNSGFTQGDASVAVDDILANMGLNTENMQVGIDARIEMYQQMHDRITQLENDRLISEQDASNARLQIWQQEQQIKLAGAETFFGTLATLSSSSNSRIASIGKAAAITQALINTYTGATKALAEGGPYLGPALAAAITAAGMVQVANIRSQNVNGFQLGGYTGDIGVSQVAGVVHGQEYVMNADTVDRVGVARLNAIQQGAEIGGSNIVVKPTIINNAAGVVNASVNTNEDEEGNLEIEVLIDQVEDSLARRVSRGDSPLLSSMSTSLGVGIKPKGF